LKSQLYEYEYGVAKGGIREKAILLHHQRYKEVGYFNSNEHDPYESQSVYFIAKIAHTDQVIGVIRLIFAELQKLPTVEYFQIYDLEKAKLSLLEPFSFAEISAFTKLPQHEVSMGLLREVYRYSIIHDIKQWICCMDEKVFHYMRRIFKFPFKEIGQPHVYLGSVTIPSSIDIQDCKQQVSKHKPKLYSYFTDNQPNLKEGVQ
jgi:N-acyl-L-homoserine lactone synthetase